MMLHLYVDSKTYVDKPLKKNPEEVMEAFKRKFRHPLKYGDREKLRAFMEENFDRVGDELLEYVRNSKKKNLEFFFLIIHHKDRLQVAKFSVVCLVYEVIAKLFNEMFV